LAPSMAERQLDTELATEVLSRARRADVPAMQQHEAAYQGEPEPEPAFGAAALAALPKEIEDPRHGFARDAHARVANDDLRNTCAARDFEHNATAGMRILRRVCEQVHEDLNETHVIPADTYRVRRR